MASVRNGVCRIAVTLQPFPQWAEKVVLKDIFSVYVQ